MDFNIRGISLTESVAADARIALNGLLGKKITFQQGICVAITLPNSPDQFAVLSQPERLLTALDGWARVFRYPGGTHDSIHVLAAADVPDGDILFYRIEFKQHASPSRRAPRPAVEVVGGAIMTYEQCAEWLLELSFNFSAGSHCTVLSRPSQSRPKQIRVAWIGPEILEGVAMPARLRAIGEVYGADIVHIPPRSYRDVSARLREALPLESVIICNHFAPYIESRIVPDSVRPNLVHICGSIARADLEHQIHTWVELAAYEIERQCYNKAVDENHGLLKIMLRGMLSHSKIGQFNHCDKATVLTSVRGRRMNVPLAEEILNRNSEAFEDTSISEALFLSKEHNDGRRYFLNPSQMDRIRIIAGLSGASTR